MMVVNGGGGGVRSADVDSMLYTKLYREKYMDVYIYLRKVSKLIPCQFYDLFFHSSLSTRIYIYRIVRYSNDLFTYTHTQ